MSFLEIPKKIGKGWESLFFQEFNKNYFKQLDQFLTEQEKEKKIIYPPKDIIFRAFELCPLEKVKVVILGQDPYYQEGKADGLAFSYSGKTDGRADSLSNIIKQLKSEGFKSDKNNTCLKQWAEQGVLLLNTVLTVEKDRPNSHRNQGWEIFTDAVIKEVNEKDDKCVFLLWGNRAKEKAKLVNRRNKHLVIEGSHPCPMSATKGFSKSAECGYFKSANNYLGQKREIDWSLISPSTC